MGLDIRVPLGMLFAILGAIMAVYGLMTRGSAMYASSGGINLNLVWGSLMLVFGLVMWFAGRKRA